MIKQHDWRDWCCFTYFVQNALLSSCFIYRKIQFMVGSFSDHNLLLFTLDFCRWNIRGFINYRLMQGLLKLERDWSFEMKITDDQSEDDNEEEERTGDNDGDGQL